MAPKGNITVAHPRVLHLLFAQTLIPGETGSSPFSMPAAASTATSQPLESLPRLCQLFFDITQALLGWMGNTVPVQWLPLTLELLRLSGFGRTS